MIAGRGYIEPTAWPPGAPATMSAEDEMAARETDNSGTMAVRPHLAFDTARLEAWLADHVDG